MFEAGVEVLVLIHFSLAPPPIAEVHPHIPFSKSQDEGNTGFLIVTWQPAKRDEMRKHIQSISISTYPKFCHLKLANRSLYTNPHCQCLKQLLKCYQIEEYLKLLLLDGVLVQYRLLSQNLIRVNSQPVCRQSYNLLGGERHCKTPPFL